MKAEFHIKGMHCASCATDIKGTLEETAGVKTADVTFSGKTAGSSSTRRPCSGRRSSGSFRTWATRPPSATSHRGRRE